jgi:hypothetical protein
VRERLPGGLTVFYYGLRRATVPARRDRNQARERGCALSRLEAWRCEPGVGLCAAKTLRASIEYGRKSFLVVPLDWGGEVSYVVLPLAGA